VAHALATRSITLSRFALVGLIHQPTCNGKPSPTAKPKTDWSAGSVPRNSDLCDINQQETPVENNEKMAAMQRQLEAQTIEGEIGLVIDYQPGKMLAINLLQAAMGMIESLDRLDAVLLSSVDTALEPVSVLNDVQHSSLKLLLARALKHTPDDLIGNLDWKKWAGGLLVKGKYILLNKLEADAPELQRTLIELEADYKQAPANLVGYKPPTVSDVRDALDGVAKARSALPGQLVRVQTEFGDIYIPEASTQPLEVPIQEPDQVVTNRGVEYFKVKSPDMLGSAQWTVLRNNRTTKVDMLHQGWVDAYHRREHAIQPGDSLKCNYEESISYDANGNELDRHLAIVEVLDVISPPLQRPLI
jgi:hypothetical protein